MCDRRRRGFALAGACAMLALAGNALEPLATRASRATQPKAGCAATPGGGLTLAALGGMRTLMADAFWLRAYVMWERRDRAACTTFARLACTLSPETASFRTGYAGWLAFDFPHWTVAEAGGFRKVSEAARAEYNRADATAALAFIDEAMASDPDNAAYGLLAGQICDVKLRDRSRAAAYYKRASESPEGPWYPTWLYVDALVLSGRPREAADFLRRYAARVPADSSRAALARECLERLPPPGSDGP